MEYGWLNVGSLLLGLAAWILPIINLAKQNKAENKNWIALAMISISACAVSLFLQILYGNHLVNIEDWSALMDTKTGVAIVSSVLLAVTLALNTATLIAYRKSGSKSTLHEREKP